MKGKRAAVFEMHEHAAWYLKALKGNGKVRKRINDCNLKEKLIEILDENVQE